MNKCDFISVKGLVARKDNILFVRKIDNDNSIEFAMAQNINFPPNAFRVNFENETEKDRTFDKIMVALTGDLT